MEFLNNTSFVGTLYVFFDFFVPTWDITLFGLFDTLQLCSCHFEVWSLQLKRIILVLHRLSVSTTVMIPMVSALYL